LSKLKESKISLRKFCVRCMTFLNKNGALLFNLNTFTHSLTGAFLNQDTKYFV
jgi:hypothetical protein